MKVIKAKKITLLLFIILTVSIVSFTPVFSAERVILTYWNGFTGPDRPILEELVKKFNETHPNIQIKMDIMPWDSFYQKLLPAYTVGKGPDIAAFATERIAQYAKAGVIVPIDDLYNKKIIDKTTIVQSLVDNLKWNGKFYGAPMNFATLLLYYNKDLFKEAGLDPERPPENWKELQEYALKLTKDIDKDGKVDQYGFVVAVKETIPMWPILIWGNNGDFISKDGSRAVINSKETVEAVSVWAELIIKHKISPIGLTGAECDKLFETKKAAMYFCGPWMTNGFTKAGLNFDTAPVPAGPKRRVTLGTGVAMVLAKSCKYKQAAYEFFKFWNSKESQIYWALGTGFPPTRVDIGNVPEFNQNPFISKFAAAASYSKFYLQGLTRFQEIDVDVITPALEEILNERKSVQRALDDAAAKINKILREN
ncbi:MAG: ABC transporter substrate-binding protein [Firmicutes bacterium]|nr:ABC transporter substrate-binding protein [Bacillota bacterium]